jgi:hypothetical protein
MTTLPLVNLPRRAAESSGPGAASAQAQIAKGPAWLERNRDQSGAWLGASMNKQRGPASDAGRFMSDTATAYSVLALSGR